MMGYNSSSCIHTQNSGEHTAVNNTSYILTIIIYYCKFSSIFHFVNINICIVYISDS